MRWIIEGEWSGYRSSQCRIVHRSVTKSQAFADEVAALGFISYTDGTVLALSVRLARLREKVYEIHGYDSLIADCVRHKVNSVQALIDIRKAGQQQETVGEKEKNAYA